MLYTILKFIFSCTLKIFFKDLQINHPEHLPKKGPFLIVSNHPNTFMDPMVIGIHLKQQSYFIAKGTLFNTALKRFLLQKVNVLPIYRSQDNNTDVNQQQKNEEIFRACYEHLGNKKVIMIFPEGTSVNQRRLQKIKTGTARIALGAEAQHDFKLGVSIVMVGLNYSDPTSFRSSLLINIDKPIQVADFEELYRKDKREAVRTLTEIIRERLAQNTIVTDDDEEDTLVRRIETIYKNRLLQDKSLPLQTAAEEAQEFRLTKGIIRAIDHFEAHEPQRVEQLEQQINTYFQGLNQLEIKDSLLDAEQRNKSAFAGNLKAAAYLIFGFPIYLYGLINNYLPYRIPSWVANAILEYEEYLGPTKMMFGMVTFTLFYSLQTYWVHQFFGMPWLTLLYFISLPLAGFFALNYWQRVQRTKGHVKLFSLFYKRNTLVASLIQQRHQIIEQLEVAKQDYLSVLEKQKTEEKG